MKTISLLLGTCLALVIIAMPATAQASASMRDYVPRDQRVDRPTTRSINNSARAYWSQNALIRHSFMRQLTRIEEKKDEVAPEYTVDPSPRYTTGEQGYIPFNLWRTRRHVRHLHWQNLLQEEPDVRRGEGSAGKIDPDAPVFEDDETVQ